MSKLKAKYIILIIVAVLILMHYLIFYVFSTKNIYIDSVFYFLVSLIFIALLNFILETYIL